MNVCSSHLTRLFTCRQIVEQLKIADQQQMNPFVVDKIAVNEWHVFYGSARRAAADGEKPYIPAATRFA